MQLPEPPPDALASSQCLQQIIYQEIEQQKGWISFARFMDLALYKPRLGYYSGGAIKLGKDGDFTTAPEITPLFGQTLASVIAPLLHQSNPHIMEFGAGSGRLAHSILTELTRQNIRVDSYTIIDLSGELKARQQETLRDFPQMTWQESLPPSFSGVIIGNEVLDAMPINLVRKTDQGWYEIGVSWTGEAFCFDEKPCHTELQIHIASQIPDDTALPIGYLTEVHPVACGFIHSLASMLKQGRGGAALLIDYGFPKHEYYLPQRNQGTLMCHYRHYAHSDPFYLPGLQDITAHVDFSAMATIATTNGLDLLTYTSQANFLIQSGITNLLRENIEDILHYLPQANAVQKLLSPAEMGELFKVLIIGKGIALSETILRGDRSHRL